jgi:hypothetical protein
LRIVLPCASEKNFFSRAWSVGTPPCHLQDKARGKLSLALPLRFSRASTPFLSRFHSVSLALPLRFSRASGHENRVVKGFLPPENKENRKNKENNNNARAGTPASSICTSRTRLINLLLFF